MALEKMQISAYEKSDFRGAATTISVMINPERYTHTHAICYNNDAAPGSNGGSPTFDKIATDTVSFDLVFDGTGVVPPAAPGVAPPSGGGIAKQIADFEDVVFAYKGNIHSPRFLQLSWGTLLFRCRLKTLDVTFTLFKPDGTPLRATARATFLGYTDRATLAKRANRSSPDLSHVVTVAAGDTLPLLCHRIYGTSVYYPQIAAINKLTDFRSLPVGARLLFPPLAGSSK